MKGKARVGSEIMTQRVLGAALLALALAAAPDARAAGMEKVDCSRLTIAVPMAADADWTECYRVHHSETSEWPDGIRADYQVLLADIRTHVLHIETGKAGTNTYFFKESIKSRLKEFDELEKMSELSEEPEFGDYELVRFQSNLWKASTDCIGFMKYTHASYTQGGGAGAGSYVVGYDCGRDGVPDRAAIEALLESIKFP
jgi:hypothetical protein